MPSFFSSDGSSTIQFAIIFLVIFAVLALVVFAFRRLTGRGHALSSKLGARGRQPRLGIVDIYELDRQRQLILLRRDNVEHLLLVGGPNDVVIERNISRGVGARLGTDEAARPEPEAEPAAALDPPRYPPAFEPAFEMPVVVAPPLPGSTARPASVGRPLDLSGPDAADDFVLAPVRVPEPAQAPAPTPRPQAEPPASRPARRMPPSLANLVPGAAKRARAAGDAQASETSSPETRVPESPAPEIRPEVEPEMRVPAAPPPEMPAAPPSQRGFDPAILSDMARQLEEAVRRPSSAVAPARPAEPAPEPAREPSPPTFVAAAVPVPVPVSMEDAGPRPEAPSTTAPVSAESATADPAFAKTAFAETALAETTLAETRPGASGSIDPMAAAMAATAEGSERDATASDDLFEAPAPIPPAPIPPATVPERPTPVVDRSIPAPDRPIPAPDETVPPVAPPPAPAKPVATAGKPAAPNPFSVEEIEAEFARLLGRPLDRKG